MGTPLNIGFLASHGGSGMRAVVAAVRAGRLSAVPRAVISNNSAAPALGFARDAGLATAHLSSVTHPDPDDLDRAILGVLAAHDVNLVVLSGYMRPLGPRVLERFQGRVVNVHPSLLPAFGGRGMYGDRVHEAVLASGERESGATVHLVTGEYDAGPVLAQARVPVLEGDTLATLRARVQAAERALLVETLARFAREELPAV